jgi:hypothetical protein
LARFDDFAAEITVGEVPGERCGDWFYIPDDPLRDGRRVIYFGSWFEFAEPGTPEYTHAELFDPNELAAYLVRACDWRFSLRARV